MKILLFRERLLLLFTQSQGKQSWLSGGPRSSPSIKPIIMWDEFVVGSLPCSSFSLYPSWFSLLLKNQHFQNEFLSVRTRRCFMEKQISIYHIIISLVNDEGN